MALMLWNDTETASVKASRIREITINPIGMEKEEYLVEGWFNTNESFNFGYFCSKKVAQAFVSGLHRQMKEDE